MRTDAAYASRASATTVSIGRGMSLAGVCLLAVTVGLLIPIADAYRGTGYLIGGVVLVTILRLLFVAPIRLLPVLTLLLTLLLPSETTLFPHLLQGAVLGVVPMGVWLMRAPSSRPAPSIIRVLAILLGGWLVLSEIFAPLHTHRGWEWLVVAFVAIVLPVLRTPQGLDLNQFRRLFLALATVLGLYALIEGFFLHSNPLFGSLFEQTDWWSKQRFSASYRVTTLLGHPLVNGTVFSAAAVLAAGELVRSRLTWGLAFARFVILTGAVLVTHSRGAAIALAVGVITVIVFGRGESAREGAGQGVRRLVLLVSAIVGMTLVVAGLQARNESRQGRTSAAVRVNVVNHVVQTLHGIEPFGAGPGESGSYRTREQLPESDVALENSYAQLVVSIGPIGALLAVALLISIIVVGLQRRAVVGEAAALLTMVVGIAGYNALEGQRMVMVLIGLLLIAILTSEKGSAETSENESAEDNPGGRFRAGLVRS